MNQDGGLTHRLKDGVTSKAIFNESVSGTKGHSRLDRGSTKREPEGTEVWEGQGVGGWGGVVGVGGERGEREGRGGRVAVEVLTESTHALTPLATVTTWPPSLPCL